jgi:hypothetical protein
MHRDLAVGCLAHRAQQPLLQCRPRFGLAQAFRPAI